MRLSLAALLALAAGTSLYLSSEEPGPRRPERPVRVVKFDPVEVRGEARPMAKVAFAPVTVVGRAGHAHR